MGFLSCLHTRIFLILTNHQEFCPALRHCRYLGCSCRRDQGIWAELVRLCPCGASSWSWAGWGRTGTNNWKSIIGLGGKQKALTGEWGRILGKNKGRAALMSCDTAAQPLGNLCCLHSQNAGKTCLQTAVFSCSVCNRFYHLSVSTWGKKKS